MSTCLRKIPIARPTLGDEEADAARRAILSGWITQGPEVAAFEEEFAACVGARHACAVSSCTTALHLALHALGVGPGDEVITVSHSYIATANAVRYCGATPVFVDIDPRTYNMDPSLLEGAITPRTRAIMPVHQMGLPCDLPGILKIADQHGLPVVEDAACAIGSEIRHWRALGADRQAAWSGRLFLVSSSQSDHHRGRGNAHDIQPRARPEVPPSPPARHEYSRHGPARRPVRGLRGVSRGRLQLSNDRHPGGHRPGPARTSSRDPDQAPDLGVPLLPGALRRFPG